MAKSPSVKALIALADSSFDGSDTSKSTGKGSDSKSDCYSYVEAVKANASVVSNKQFIVNNENLTLKLVPPPKQDSSIEVNSTVIDFDENAGGYTSDLSVEDEYHDDDMKSKSESDVESLSEDYESYTSSDVSIEVLSPPEKKTKIGIMLESDDDSSVNLDNIDMKTVMKKANVSPDLAATIQRFKESKERLKQAQTSQDLELESVTERIDFSDCVEQEKEIEIVNVQDHIEELSACSVTDTAKNNCFCLSPFKTPLSQLEMSSKANSVNDRPMNFSEIIDVYNINTSETVIVQDDENIPEELTCVNEPRNHNVGNSNSDGNLLSELSSSQLQSAIDQAVDTTKVSWSAPIVMQNIVIDYDILNSNYLRRAYTSRMHPNDDTSKVDILTALKIPKVYKPMFYFDSQKYPVSPTGFKGKKWKNLLNAINDACSIEGYKVFNHGKHSSIKGNSLILKCYRGKKYKTSDKSDKEYRKTKLINNKSCSRGKKGLKGSRKRNTHRTTKTEELCKMFFIVGYNSKGYFVYNGYGHECHNDHNPALDNLQNFSTKNIDPKDLEIADVLQKTNNSAGVIRNVLNHNTGRILSVHNITYLMKKLKGSPLEKTLGVLDKSSVDKMIQYFKDKGFHYYCLLHRLEQGLGVNNVGVVTENNHHTGIPSFVHLLPEREQKEVLQFCLENRDILELEHYQQLMLAVAWISKEELRLMYLYPEVLFMDVTSDTNKEKRPLFTVTGRTAQGKMFTILRAFMPNEKSWIFNWIFSVVFKNTFEERLIKRVVYVLTDGDPQEYQQLDNAINEFFPQARRGRCGYHLCTKTFETHGPNLGKKDQKKNHLKHYHMGIIKAWVYSWMKDHCETIEEYHCSKMLLEAYLNSNTILNDVGEEYVTTVKKVIREKIEPHKKHFLFCHRNNLRAFDEYSNSAHEGTNAGLKYCSMKAVPTLNVDSASKRLSDYGILKYDEFVSDSKRRSGQNKPWNELKCSKYLIDRCLGILIQEYEHSTNYEISRQTETVFMVQLIEGSRKVTTSIVPIFRHRRTVIIEQGVLKCDCNLFDRIGIPCRHMWSILRKQLNFQGPSHHDIAVRWWADHSVHAFPLQVKQETKHITDLLEMLSLNDITGPKIRTNDIMLEVDTQPTERLVWWRENGCVNYDVSHIQYLENNPDITFGLSQLSHTGENRLPYQQFTDDVCKAVESNKKLVEDAEDMVPKDIWGFFSPLFRELVSSCEGVVDRERLNSISEALRKEVTSNQKIAKTQKKEKPKGTIISSALPTSRKRKTHGV